MFSGYDVSLEGVQRVVAGWQEGVIPDPVQPEGRWQYCDKYCPFVERCWPQGVERK